MPRDYPTAMPTAFFGHGSPMNALERNAYTLAWQQFGRTAPRPRAILCISAHWYTRGTAVTAMPRPKTIHDFGGFPRELYDVEYPAPGDPGLAARVSRLLGPTEVIEDTSEWGLDHGAWSVLKHLYPQADIPVVQMSLDASQPLAYHYRLAKSLAPLRDEGVLVMGSGNVVHNLRMARWGDDAAPFAWASRFNAYVRSRLLANDHAALADMASMGADAPLCIPTAEHYLPLLYVVALQGPCDELAFLTDGIELGSISMLSLAFCAEAGEGNS
jgi:4,5-DOPA dioxygenase extradiol